MRGKFRLRKNILKILKRWSETWVKGEKVLRESEHSSKSIKIRFMMLMRPIVRSMTRHTLTCLHRMLQMSNAVGQCATNSTNRAVRISTRMMNFSAKAIAFNSVTRSVEAITNSILLITDNINSNNNIAPNDKILVINIKSWPQVDIPWLLVGLLNMVASKCIHNDRESKTISHSEAQAL